LEHVERGLCEIVHGTQDDEARAIAILRDHQDKAYSFCDALSFAVMERLGVTEVIAFDRHFREYGRLTIL
jgi:predicted nucleic acid-binding protein